MKSSLLFSLALLSLLANARADLTIVQKVEGADGSHQITMKVKGDKARVEVGPQVTTILDAKSGDIVNLMTEKKMVMRIPGEKAKMMAEMAKSFVKGEAGDQATPKATGKKQTINGYETVEYVSESPKFHATYWVATTYPDYKNILQQMAILQKGAFEQITKGMPNYHALPGLPLRTEVKVSGQEEPIVSTIESVKTSPLPDSDFSVPAGYSEMKLPDFLGGQQPAKPGNP
ncbi:MAG: DUF4412 domain-containing protein [Verrucomicrobiota bacterium]|nr:DUF4412 domain-containing protein [Verrucomicrobiota bacterium]